MKPVYRQSSLQYYPTCPHKFTLAQEESLKQTMPMREGLLFEGYLFGFKDDNEKELIGRKKTETIDKIKSDADFVRKYFLDGSPFVRMVHEADEYIIRGEADYIGLFRNQNNYEMRQIVDVKYTASIGSSWNYYRTEKIDFLQSPDYSYLHFKNTGEVLNMTYLLVESQEDGDPILKTATIFITEKSYQWFENLIKMVHFDMFKDPKPGDTSCYHYKTKQKCPFLRKCKIGLEYYAGHVDINFDELEDSVDFSKLAEKELNIDI